MTAATLPPGYTLTDDGGPARPGWRYVLHRDGVRVATVYRETDGTYTAHGWHYLHRLPWHGPGADGRHRHLVADTPTAAAELVVTALKSGSIARHADEIGHHGVADLLAAQGLDINAPTLQQQAQDQGREAKRF